MDYQTWFRKWNNLAYDWLHQYLFADIKAVRGGVGGEGMGISVQ